MLTAKMVRVRRRHGRLEVVELGAAERQRMLHHAEACIGLAQEHVGKTRGELLNAWGQVPHDGTDYKIVSGLHKLILDRCDFDVRDDVDPRALRRAVFQRSAATRQAMADHEIFDRKAVLNEATREKDVTAEDIDEALYADLKENNRLIRFDWLSPSSLMSSYDIAQKQAVLLRAIKLVVQLRCPVPSGYRRFFRRLKFCRLLHTIQPSEGGYRIEIDGPFSLFRSVTKYGLQLALLLPVLEGAGAWSLDADVLWGAEREPFAFHLEGQDHSSDFDRPRLPDEVARLMATFAKRDTPWQVDVSGDLLELPGVGLCVPDLVFIHGETKQRVYLEVMGYWSRAAVWKRVELVQAGLPDAILFAVSSRLRVSEEVLGDDLPGQLYVYKGAMSATVIAERLDAISQ